MNNTTIAHMGSKPWVVSSMLPALLSINIDDIIIDEMSRIEEAGNRYGEYTVIGRSEKKWGNETIWKCRCSCGTIANVRGSDLRGGKTKGCRSCATSKARLKDLAGQKFGYGR